MVGFIGGPSNTGDKRQETTRSKDNDYDVVTAYGLGGFGAAVAADYMNDE